MGQDLKSDLISLPGFKTQTQLEIMIEQWSAVMMLLSWIEAHKGVVVSMSSKTNGKGKMLISMRAEELDSAQLRNFLNGQNVFETISMEHILTREKTS